MLIQLMFLSSLNFMGTILKNKQFFWAHHYSEDSK